MVGADLLVVGSRGRGGFRRALLGSVSQQVALHAPCPVTIVRPAGPAESFPAGLRVSTWPTSRRAVTGRTEWPPPGSVRPMRYAPGCVTVTTDPHHAAEEYLS